VAASSLLATLSSAVRVRYLAARLVLAAWARLRRTPGTSGWPSFHRPTPGKVLLMRFPWQPREYARTCAECGHSWRVPRWAAQPRVRSISGMSVASRTTIDRGELTREVDSVAAANQSADTYRHCPKCGADHFTQRALRGGGPPSP
jgi:hypothetical protein